MRDRSATSARILKAASELLAESGFQNFGVNAIARRAGCDKQLIYRYYGGMDGLVDAIGGELARWIEQKMPVGGSSGYQAGLNSIAGIAAGGVVAVKQAASERFADNMINCEPARDADTGLPHEESCGSCTRCLDICPTKAFPAPFQLDARKCLAYLNNEHKGQIPLEYRVAMGNRIYGCDDCLAVCPWNKFASASREAKLAARDDLNAPALGGLAKLDDSGFRALFSGSPIKRIGHGRFLRNVMIAVGNSGNVGLAPLAEARLDDDDPLVRGAAVWAVRRLDPQKAERLALDFLPRESDTAVRNEWTQSLE